MNANLNHVFLKYFVIDIGNVGATIAAYKTKNNPITVYTILLLSTIVKARFTILLKLSDKSIYIYSR